ncbi:unnamed protein product [Echinostoma caproni]|uniref:DEAD domain-containing protein n=1 Tax=Echinostoma caproni TaxID=27848 RepID=A0A183BA88_9TREM|nr:unnamed protein product [Echinostoma caproni]
MMDFGLDLEELSSAFEVKEQPETKRETEERPLNFTDYEEKKRKAEASLMPLIENLEETENTSLPQKRSKLTEELDALEFKAPRIKIYKISAPDSCTHEVAVPPNMEYQPLTKDTRPPAKTYPFVLDAFQQQAITCIDNNQSVMISAHTSAGKTAVAE